MTKRKSQLKFLKQLINCCYIISESAAAGWLIDVEHNFYDIVQHHIHFGFPNNQWYDYIEPNDYDYIIKIGKLALQKQVWIMTFDDCYPSNQLVSLNMFEKIHNNRDTEKIKKDPKFIKQACLIKGYHHYRYSKKQLKLRKRKDERNKNFISPILTYVENASMDVQEFLKKWSAQIKPTQQTLTDSCNFVKGYADSTKLAQQILTSKHV